VVTKVQAQSTDVNKHKRVCTPAECRSATSASFDQSQFIVFQTLTRLLPARRPAVPLVCVFVVVCLHAAPRVCVCTAVSFGRLTA